MTFPLIFVCWVFWFSKFSLRLFPFSYHLYTVIRYDCKCQLCDRNYKWTAENIRIKFTVLMKAVPQIYRLLLVFTLVNCPCAYPGQGFFGEGGIGWRSHLQTWFYWCSGPTPFSRGKEGLKQLLCCDHMQLHVILIFLLSNMI